MGCRFAFASSLYIKTSHSAVLVPGTNLTNLIIIGDARKKRCTRTREVFCLSLKEPSTEHAHIFMQETCQIRSVQLFIIKSSYYKKLPHTQDRKSVKICQKSQKKGRKTLLFQQLHATVP